MKPYRKEGLTLIELLVAIMLVMVVIVGLNSISSFSHFHIISSSRQSKLQNELSTVLGYMKKELVTVNGNEIISGADSIVDIDINSPNQDLDRASFFIDTDNDGSADRWVAFRYDTNAIAFCADCGAQASCGSCLDAGGWPGAVTVGENIVAFNVTKPVDSLGRLNENYIDVAVTACWDPSQDCGTVDNPSVNMTASVIFPVVSTN